MLSLYINFFFLLPINIIIKKRFGFPSLLFKKESPFILMRDCDENHKVFNDPLHVLVGLITKARSKKIKEALNGLIQEIWADSITGRFKLGPKEDEGVINLIQAIEG